MNVMPFAIRSEHGESLWYCYRESDLLDSRVLAGPPSADPMDAYRAANHMGLDGSMPGGFREVAEEERDRILARIFGEEECAAKP